ncbi:MAG: PrsW family intramembrane metalloprotease [Chloroflexi bacterium]|nr:PrsW family intramembrane metalloprotease [Chloroflexota bacterium]
MTCRSCGRETPEGAFCTWCGARQDADPGGPAARRFAASPGETVISPSVLTTLLPHLGGRGVREYRWAFGAGLVLLVGLYLLGFISAALTVAAVLVPVIYVMYLYEARVYRDAPVPVLLATIGGGILVGIVLTLLVDPLIAANPIFVDGVRGPVIDVTALLLATVLVPVVQEIVKPIPALVLRGRPEFGHSIDGLVFGVAAGLGFVMAETVIHYWPAISRMPIQQNPGAWIIPLLSVAILVPLVNASATGLVTAAIWRLGRRPVTRLAAGAILAAVVGHVAFTLGSMLLISFSLHAIFVVLWQVIVMVALLVAVRIVLDTTLHEEAVEEGLLQTTCANCGASVLASGFCPECGVAMPATAHISNPIAAASGDVAPGGAR